MGEGEERCAYHLTALVAELLNSVLDVRVRALAILTTPVASCAGCCYAAKGEQEKAEQGDDGLHGY